MSTLQASAAVETGSGSALPIKILSPQRVASVDILRGTVMVLMAIDHVRVFSGLPAGGPTPGIFFTRWVTHFCAPWFIFLAGTSAFLRGEKLRSQGKAALARYLLLRGLGLVLLELTLLRLCWTFNFDYAHYMLAGVIWVIGWCMVLMAGLIWLPPRVVGIMGVIIIAGHNVVDPFRPHLIEVLRHSPLAWIWQVLYFGGWVQIGGDNGLTLAVLYSIIPWIGVMAAGYWFGTLLRAEAARRNLICYILGAATVAAFLILRGWNLYGDPTHWTAAGKFPPLLSFLNTTKYPASLQFLLMTLGPAFLLVPLLDKMRGFAANVLTVFGRVPFFYYVLHIPLIHAAAIVVSLVRTGHVDPWLFANHPMLNPPAPAGYTWNLGLLYAVWAMVMLLLYFSCRWYTAWKSKPAGIVARAKAA
ncbi:MAG TPA: heparan-alpha-glucosaminide N-acetyltransferase domain-containing protein [Candidatus Angelobacter sp.]|nr:heparan-alpha-glucosaminide N-acetyltransferase domain-containing protein [Candidatus Angelobacter sp.]